MRRSAPGSVISEPSFSSSSSLPARCHLWCLPYGRYFNRRGLGDPVRSWTRLKGGPIRLRRVGTPPGQAAWTCCLHFPYCYGSVDSDHPFMGAERLWTQRSVSVDSAPLSPWTRREATLSASLGVPWTRGPRVARAGHVDSCPIKARLAEHPRYRGSLPCTGCPAACGKAVNSAYSGSWCPRVSTP